MKYVSGRQAGKHDLKNVLIASLHPQPLSNSPSGEPHPLPV